MLTGTQLARKLRRSDRTIYRLLKQLDDNDLDRLGILRVGSTFAIPEDSVPALRALAEERTTHPRGPKPAAAAEETR